MHKQIWLYLTVPPDGGTTTQYGDAIMKSIDTNIGTDTRVTADGITKMGGTRPGHIKQV
jgi:hypothetical protein